MVLSILRHDWLEMANTMSPVSHRSTTNTDMYEDDNNYYLILDLVSGGEMFDHLINYGAYSEADAARLMYEIASALAFMHGVGVVYVCVDCHCVDCRPSLFSDEHLRPIPSLSLSRSLPPQTTVMPI